SGWVTGSGGARWWCTGPRPGHRGDCRAGGVIRSAAPATARASGPVGRRGRDTAGEEVVERADDDDEQEQHPRNGGGTAEVLLIAPGDVVEVQHRGHPVAARSTEALGVEHADLVE